MKGSVSLRLNQESNFSINNSCTTWGKVPPDVMMQKEVYNLISELPKLISHNLIKTLDPISSLKERRENTSGMVAWRAPQILSSVKQL